MRGVAGVNDGNGMNANAFPGWTAAGRRGGRGKPLIGLRIRRGRVWRSKRGAERVQALHARRLAARFEVQG